METAQMDFTQTTENIADFLKKRNAVKTKLNNEIKILTEKLQTEAENNEKRILFSIPFDETTVTFGKQQMKNFFDDVELPKEGLFLREIKIAHVEYAEDMGFEYCSDIKIQFEFSDDYFNGKISLEHLGFNDEKQRISEQIVGLGFNPCFANAIKYEEMRDTLRNIRETIKREEKKSKK